jgi:hypothetical protein
VSDHDGIPVHLRPIEADIVNALCDRADAIAAQGGTLQSYIALESRGFRESRTPWDARRLARALSIDHFDDPLVEELFNLALQRAGLKPDLQRGQK